MEAIQRWVDGKIDFQGQRLCDRIMQEGLVAGALIAFVLGYATQNMQLCMLTFLASTLLVALVTVPAWPFYNKYHVEWLPASSSAVAAGTDTAAAQTSSPAADAQESSSAAAGKKRSVTVK